MSKRESPSTVPPVATNGWGDIRHSDLHCRSKESGAHVVGDDQIGTVVHQQIHDGHVTVAGGQVQGGVSVGIDVISRSALIEEFLAAVSAAHSRR